MQLLARAACIFAVLISARAVTDLQQPESDARWQGRNHVPRNEQHTEKKSVFLMAVITSPAGNHARRHLLREQWQRNIQLLRAIPVTNTAIRPDVVMIFVIGTENVTQEERNVVQREEESFGDILILHGISDQDRGVEDNGWPWNGTSATTEKVVYSMQWAVEKYTFQYFARLGDDAYFRPDEFYRQVDSGEIPTSMALIGHFIGPYVYDTGFGMHNSVVYPSGMGYVVTFDLCSYIAHSAGVLGVGFPEDAVVGSWLAGTKAKYVHAADKFHDVHPPDYGYRPCTPKDLLLHRMRTAEDWKAVGTTGLVVC